MMRMQKSEFYGKVPIAYFSDAFQDILARDGFLFYFMEVLKDITRKKSYHVS